MTAEQTYHRSESSERSGVGNQSSQGVLLTRSVDHMSVVCHHDGHLLHHLDSWLFPAARRSRGWRRRGRRRRRKSGGDAKERSAADRFCFSQRVEEATGCFQESLRSWAPPTERRRGAGSEKAVQHTCLSLSPPLCNARSVWQRRRMSLLFLPFHWVSISLSLSHLCLSLCLILLVFLSLFQLQSQGFVFFSFLLLIKIKIKVCFKGLFTHLYCVCVRLREIGRKLSEQPQPLVVHNCTSFQR